MNWLAFILFSLFLSGCAGTALNYEKNQIIIENEDISHSFFGKTLDKKQVNLSQINIEQKVFQNDYNEILVYEQARVNTGYKFKSTYHYIFGHIFNANKVTKVQEKNGLGFYIIRLKNNQKIYLLAKIGSKKSLTLLYGLSEVNFYALANNHPLVKQHTLQKEQDNTIQTLWSAKLIVTGVLLQAEAFKVSH